MVLLYHMPDFKRDDYLVLSHIMKGYQVNYVDQNTRSQFKYTAAIYQARNYL